MAEIYDYLNVATRDYAYNLDVMGYCKMLAEENDETDQDVRLMDDGSDETISFSDVPIVYFDLDLSITPPAIADIVFDLYYDPTKANRRAKSFGLIHQDGHIYVVKFASRLRREWQAGIDGLRPLGTVRFRAIGVITDA